MVLPADCIIGAADTIQGNNVKCDVIYASLLYFQEKTLLHFLSGAIDLVCCYTDNFKLTIMAAVIS